MPGLLLHLGATLLCAHAGPAQPVMANLRVRVGGQPVTTQTASYVVAGCSLAGSGGPFCATARFVSAATRVRAGGTPVLLRDSVSVCMATGTALNVAATQARVRGI